MKFLVGNLQINHIIFVGFASANHGAGGEHVENHFLGGTRLHAGRAANYLRTNFGADENIGMSLKRGIGIGADGDWS